MKIGVKKLELVEASAVADFSFFSPGSTIPLADYISEAATEFKFTPGTGSFEEDWPEDSGGILSEISVSVTNREQKDTSDSKFTKAIAGYKIAIVTLLDGRVKIVGSKNFPAKVSLSTGITGFETSEKTLQITCRSPHGSYYGR